MSAGGVEGSGDGAAGGAVVPHVGGRRQLLGGPAAARVPGARHRATEQAARARRGHRQRRPAVRIHRIYTLIINILTNISLC